MSKERVKEKYLINVPKHRLHDRDEVRFQGEVGDIEQPFQFLQSSGDGSTRHESYYDCMGEELGDKPQPGQEEKRKHQRKPQSSS